MVPMAPGLESLWSSPYQDKSSHQLARREGGHVDEEADDEHDLDKDRGASGATLKLESSVWEEDNRYRVSAQDWCIPGFCRLSCLLGHWRVSDPPIAIVVRVGVND